MSQINCGATIGLISATATDPPLHPHISSYECGEETCHVQLLGRSVIPSDYQSQRRSTFTLGDKRKERNRKQEERTRKRGEKNRHCTGEEKKENYIFSNYRSVILLGFSRWSLADLGGGERGNQTKQAKQTDRTNNKRTHAHTQNIKSANVSFSQHTIPQVRLLTQDS